MMNQTARIAARMTALIAALSVPAFSYAQNCALCYTQAAGSGSRVIQALKSGILILVIPPMLICLGITWMAYKKNNEFNEELPADVSESGSKS